MLKRFGALVLFATGLFGASWKPLDPVELALKAPKVEKDADAEALFWEVSVADEFNGGYPQTVLQHYIRAKIFNDRGLRHATVDLLYFGQITISDIAGRTIKPDGSTIDLKKDAVFDKVVVKTGGIKIKARSFVLPNVVTGDLIEYRLRETRKNQLTHYA